MTRIGAKLTSVDSKLPVPPSTELCHHDPDEEPSELKLDLTVGDSVEETFGLDEATLVRP